MLGYHAFFEPAEEGGFIVTFPDFGFGVTDGKNEAEAIEMAGDALICLLEMVIEEGKPLPAFTKQRGKQYRMVRLPAMVAAKAELYRAFIASGMRKSELARRTGINKVNIIGCLICGWAFG